MKRLIVSLVVVGMLLVPVAETAAAVRGISRANCFTRNESITWESPWIYRTYYTISSHYQYGAYQHTLYDMRYGAYATAGDWEAWTPTWAVAGAHYFWTFYWVPVGYTYTTWCEAWSW